MDTYTVVHVLWMENTQKEYNIKNEGGMGVVVVVRKGWCRWEIVRGQY